MAIRPVGVQDHERQVLAGHGQTASANPNRFMPHKWPSIQAYMEASIPGISANPALFTAINKDLKIWFELVPFDGGLAQRMSDRAVRSSRQRDSRNSRRAMQPRQRMSRQVLPLADRCWSST